MTYTTTDLGVYAELLYQAETFEQAFTALEMQAVKLGFDATFYAYIPRLLLLSNFSAEPVFKMSENYCPGYMAHYAEAQYAKYDPLIMAVNDGHRDIIDWWGDVNQHYMKKNRKSKKVITLTRHYGIANGVTIPLLCGEKGIAATSFICQEKRFYGSLKKDNFDKLKLCSTLFHNKVLSHSDHNHYFIQPLFDTFSQTEKHFLRELALGNSPSQVSKKLNKSEKYLEQVMLKIRRKFSYVASDEPANINRNQILYHTGLLGLLESLD